MLGNKRRFAVFILLVSLLVSNWGLFGNISDINACAEEAKELVKEETNNLPTETVEEETTAEVVEDTSEEASNLDELEVVDITEPTGNSSLNSSETTDTEIIGAKEVEEEAVIAEELEDGMAEIDSVQANKSEEVSEDNNSTEILEETTSAEALKDEGSRGEALTGETVEIENSAIGEVAQDGQEGLLEEVVDEDSHQETEGQSEELLEELEVDPSTFIEVAQVLAEDTLRIFEVSSFRDLKDVVTNTVGKFKIVLNSAQDSEAYKFDSTIEITGDKHVELSTNGTQDEQVVFERQEKTESVSAFLDRFFHVEKGSSLTLTRDEDKAELILDGNNVELTKESQATMIGVEGELVIDGAILQNENISGRMAAPIYAAGAEARIIFRSGSIRNNQVNKSTGASAGILLNDFANMHMTGGSIYNNDTVSGKSNYFNSGAISVFNGSELIFDDGHIYDNKGQTGGILVGTSNYSVLGKNRKQDTESGLDLTDLNIATAEINGGLIERNHGSYIGGGLFVFGPGKAVMNGGKISHNTSPRGGGVGTWDYYSSGLYYEDKEWGDIDYEIYAKYFPASFEMNGGVISCNSASSTGGGISVASNNVLLKGGIISKNSAKRHGGGVYVTSVPYTLQVKNAYISGNAASSDKTKRWIADPTKTKQYTDSKGKVWYGEWVNETPVAEGGGVWFCPTGSAIFYAKDGAVIVDNSAMSAGDDFSNNVFQDNEEGQDTFLNQDGKFLDFYVTLPERIRTGQKIAWYEDDEGNRYEAGSSVEVTDLENFCDIKNLKVILDDEVKVLGRATSNLFITGNTANYGGGIGSNGSIIFGTAGEIDIQVEKTWMQDLEKKPVDIEVLIEIDGKEYVLDTMVLSDANNFTDIFRGLPDELTIIEGIDEEKQLKRVKTIDAIYFREKQTGYIVSISPPRETGREEVINLLTNRTDRSQAHTSLVTSYLVGVHNDIKLPPPEEETPPPEEETPPPEEKTPPPEEEPPTPTKSYEEAPPVPTKAFVQNLPATSSAQGAKVRDHALKVIKIAVAVFGTVTR